MLDTIEVGCNIAPTVCVPVTMLVTDTSRSIALTGSFACLTTYRRTGQAIPTTIWFALGDANVYFFTGARTGKAKRIGRTPTVSIGPSNARGKLLGAQIKGRARVLSGAEEHAAYQRILAKYGWQFVLIHTFNRLFGRAEAYFEIVPDELPPAVRSEGTSRH